MRNIAIVLNSGNPNQRNEITKFLVAMGWAYWHWIDDFWIVQVPYNYTARSLHEEIEKLPEIGEPTMLVFEFEGNISFWGRNEMDAWDWLNHIGNPS